MKWAWLLAPTWCFGVRKIQTKSSPSLPRRIVIFGPGPGEPGGAPRRAHLLASGLAARGWTVYLVGRSTSRQRFRLARTGTLTVVEVPGFHRPRAGTVLFLACAVPLGIALGWRGASFLAIQLVAPSTAAALCAAVLRRPYVAMATTSGTGGEVAHLLDADLQRRGNWSVAAYRVDRWLRRRLLRRASFVVAQNAAGASELSRVMAPQRIVVLPTPVEQVQAPPLHRRPHAVFVGRFSKDKDLLNLLEAWLAVVALRPEARLTLVGDGGDHQSVEAELRRLVTQLEPLARTVTFTGWVEDATPYLASSDVFVFPSLTEGMSNALLEACAWGRVVVASDIPANRAVLADDHPLIFPAGDVDALSNKLLLAFDDHRIAEDARHRALTGASSFSTESVVKRLEDLLKQANDTARPGPSQEDAGPRTPRIGTDCSAAGTLEQVQSQSD